MKEHREQEERSAGPQVERRSFLKGALGVAAGTGAGLVMPTAAGAAPGRAHRGTSRLAASAARRRSASRRDMPLPKVERSRKALGTRALAAVDAGIPVTQGGTTYEMAQEARWLDAQHFAVGRWDGSMSIFEFETAQYVGPLINEAVNTPAFQGVRMVTRLPGHAIATSNDDTSIALWHAAGGDWTRLKLHSVHAYDPSLGAATAGAALSRTNPSTLVLGHASGYLSIWSYDRTTRTLAFLRSVNVQNPNPVNPWGDHTIEDLVVADPAAGVVAAGSEDGYVTMLAAPSGTILSQTVFNPQAQRGINAVSVAGNRLLVANCSVGPDDFNLWYFAIDSSNWSIRLLDKKNLIIDTTRPQVFNFDVVWGRYSGGRCWFASTEEGALWMGTATAQSLNELGYDQLTAPLGSALAYHKGELVMVAYDLYQFTTGA